MLYEGLDDKGRQQVDRALASVPVPFDRPPPRGRRAAPAPVVGSGRNVETIMDAFRLPSA